MSAKKLLTVLLVLSLGVIPSAPAMAAAPRFGIDEYNTRQIKDSFTETGLPFKLEWTADLGGQVESQPIIPGDGFIYIQAGKELLKLNYAGNVVAKSGVINNHTLASGSSPTYANTIYGPRIYQATRDHNLWALDPDTLQPLWNFPGKTNFYVLSAGTKPTGRYRVTASPLVVTEKGAPIISIGTAHGDGTSNSGQYADDGFFVLRDNGGTASNIYNRRMDGEVTGSPIYHNGYIIATQNRWMANSSLILYDIQNRNEIIYKPPTDNGIPGSPVAEGNFLYTADQKGLLNKFQIKGDDEFVQLWESPAADDSDYGRRSNTRNLKTPTIGSKYIYLPIQNYKNASSGGPGAVVAVDKNNGKTHQVKKFSSPLKANILYWKPDAEEDKDYIFVLESNGNMWVLDGETLEPECWFLDEKGKVQQSVKVADINSSQMSPELVIADSLLLVTDGAGIMRAYKGIKPINFQAVKLGPVEDKQYKAGDDVTWNVTVKNTSEIDYSGIPLTITSPNGLTAETSVALKAGESKTVTGITMKVPKSNEPFVATINPLGHAKEKKEEIKPRKDNEAKCSLNKNSNDLEVTSLTITSPTETGKVQSIKTVITNNSAAELKDVVIVWRQDKDVIREERMSFGAGQALTSTFTWRSPEQEDIVNISVMADPDHKTGDLDYTNNFIEKYVIVNKFTVRSCNNQLPSASWDVIYWIITGYPTYTETDSWTDEKGVEHSSSYTWTDYSDPIWEPRTVIYYETLSETFTVNTKQGIPTDPAKPKPEDRESRGAWAIIPYAQRMGLDPNTITRAGYGFEVKVQTTYWTDWETKVANGLEGTAQPIGLTFNGPSKVTAIFYDTHGRKVDEVQMERTGGTNGIGSATWELPMTSYRFSDGTTIFERKHYTDTGIRDGDYTVMIHAEYAGMNGLWICTTKTVKIWGSMYDDQYTAPVPIAR